VAKSTKATRNNSAKTARAGTRASKTAGKSGPTQRASKKSVRSSAKIMGIRVPSTLRNALDNLVNSERGRELLASALVAAATAAAAALVKSSDSSQPAKARLAAADVGDQAGEATKDVTEFAAGAVADLVTGAVRTFLPKAK
jgi:hypothetical protein